MKKAKTKQLVLKKSYSRVYENQVTKAEKMLSNRKRISKCIRKARSFVERMHNLPKFDACSRNICNLCDLLADFVEGIYQNAPLATIVSVLGGLLYLVLPFDVIPDIPFIGWFDDAAVLAFVVAAVQNDVKEYLDWKAQYPIVDAEEITAY